VTWLLHKLELYATERMYIAHRNTTPFTHRKLACAGTSRDSCDPLVSGVFIYKGSKWFRLRYGGYLEAFSEVCDSNSEMFAWNNWH
jgi:hypothetical protein